MSASKTLVIDIGGTAVKLWLSGKETIKFNSGSWLTPQRLVPRVLKRVADWEYDRVALGYPGKVIDGEVAHEPWNLGDGWVGFDFSQAFKRPVRIMNDASLQALGNYEGGRMLFLGLGTSLGGAVIADNVIVSLEPGALGHPAAQTLEDHHSSRALRANGRIAWRQAALDVLPALRYAFLADYVVVGGGNAKLLRKLPEDCRRGKERATLRGGERLWESQAFGSIFIYTPPDAGQAGTPRKAAPTPVAVKSPAK